MSKKGNRDSSGSLKMTIVLFDTNTARSLGHYLDKDNREQSIVDFAEKMMRHGYELYVSPIVIQELLSHIDRDGDPREFNACCNSIRNLVDLWKQFPNWKEKVAWPADIIIADIFFNHSLKNRTEMYGSFLTHAVDNLASLKNEEVEDVITEDGEKLADFIKRMQNDFAERLLKAVERSKLQSIDQSMQKDFASTTCICYTLISMMHELLKDDCGMPTPSDLFSNESNLSIKAEKIDNFIISEYKDFASFFPVANELYKIISNRIFESGGQMRKEKIRNYLQDIFITFHIGSTINGIPVLLVTEDKAIVKAVEQVHINGVGQEYMKKLVASMEYFMSKCIADN